MVSTSFGRATGYRERAPGGAHARTTGAEAARPRAPHGA